MDHERDSEVIGDRESVLEHEVVRLTAERDLLRAKLASLLAFGAVGTARVQLSDQLGRDGGEVAA
jgi:hypothetical protein